MQLQILSLLIFYLEPEDLNKHNYNSQVVTYACDNGPLFLRIKYIMKVFESSVKIYNK
jgi:hypothetical protein